MSIRLANGGDVARLCELYRQFYAYNAAQQPGHCCAAEEKGDYPRGVIQGDSGDIFVAQAGEGLVGFIHVEREQTAPFPSVAAHAFASIVDFYLEPAHRRKGLGTALLTSARQWAKSRGLAYLELLVLEENPIGLNFYAREDFKPAARVLRQVL